MNALVRFWQWSAAMMPSNGILGAVLSGLAYLVRGIFSIVLAVFNSGKAALAQPMVYPIVAAMAFGGFILGHVEGTRPVKVLRLDIEKITAARDRVAAQNRVLRGDLSAMETRAVTAETKLASLGADGVGKPVPAPTPAKTPVKAAKPKPKPAVRPDTGIFGLFN